MVFGFFEGQFVRAVAVGVGDIGFVGLVFEVFGEGDGIEPIFQGFCYADIGPYGAIGEYGMHVKVAFHDLVAGYMGKLKAAAHAVAMRAFLSLCDCCKGYE